MIWIIFILLLAGSSSDAGNANSRRRHRSRRRHHGHHTTKKPDTELQTLVSKLWDLDKNRAQVGKDFNISYQGKAVFGEDNAPNPLISGFNPEILNKTTVKALIALYDNYNYVDGVAEVVTKEEIAENNHFLDLVIKSDVMQAVYSFLKKKGKASTDPSVFKKTLYRLWFEIYPRHRGGVRDSSGFEHVFVGEVNRQKHDVGGFHNWIHLHLEEKAKHLNYLGYLKVVKDGSLISTFRFTWMGTLKPTGGCFIGTSPEFEMSLYSAVYMLGYNHASLLIDGLKIQMTCWPINNNHNIGTCYPALR